MFLCLDLYRVNSIERREGYLPVLASLEKLLNKEMYVTLTICWFFISYKQVISICDCLTLYSAVVSDSYI